MVTAAPGHAAVLWQDTLADLSRIDVARTGAVVDTAARQIRLPGLPSAVAFWPDGSSQYVVVRAGGQVQAFHWDGTAMVPGQVIANLPTRPLGAAFLDGGTVVVLTETGWQAYHWTGSAWVSNPWLAVSGLSGAVALAAGNQAVTAAQPGQVAMWDVRSGSPVPDATRSVSAANPLAVALAGPAQDLIVLGQDGGGRTVTYYSYTGSGLSPNPFLSVSGVPDPRAVARTDDGATLVLDGTQVRQYRWTGSGLASGVLFGGLGNPTAVAVRPGSGDVAVVDGGQVRYYRRQPDGSYVRVAAMEAPVADAAAYPPAREARSVAVSAPGQVGAVRVTAAASVPAGTAVAWWVSSDGGISWTATSLGQWAVIPPGQRGSSVVWRANLQSLSGLATPVISGPVTVETNSPPAITGLSVTPKTGAWVTSLTPRASWTFSDSDPGDSQSGWQAVLLNRDTLATVWNSGKVTTLASAAPPDDGAGLRVDPAGANTYVDLPASAIVGAGTYRFRVRVRVWDQADAPSAWAEADFDVLAAGNLRVWKIVDPPPGQAAPPPEIWTLPVQVKAGAEFGIAVDVVGPPGVTVTGQQVAAWENKAVSWSFKSGTRWEATTYTDPTLPDGTAVTERVGVAAPDATVAALGPAVTATIRGSVLENWVVINTR